VFEQLQAEHGLPQVLRTDNVLIASDFFTIRPECILQSTQAA